jgi:hypothetical protein
MQERLRLEQRVIDGNDVQLAELELAFVLMAGLWKSIGAWLILYIPACWKTEPKAGGVPTFSGIRLANRGEDQKTELGNRAIRPSTRQAIAVKRNFLGRPSLRSYGLNDAGIVPVHKPELCMSVRAAVL